MSFPNVISGSAAAVALSSTDKRHRLGTRMVLVDGREFRYCQAGAVALVAGSVYQAPAPDADHTGLAVDTIAAGATSITGVDLGGTDNPAANYFQDGFLWVDTATGIGRAYPIKSSTAPASAGATITVTLYEPLDQAIAAADTVSLVPNSCKAVIVHPSPATGKLAGVAVEAVAAGSYGWLQTKGPCAVLTQGTVVINEEVVDSATVDGAVAAPVLTEAAPNTGYGQHIVGVVLTVEGDGQVSLINLSID